MTKFFRTALFLLGLGLCSNATHAEGYWKPISADMAPSKALMPFQPSSYKVFQLDVAALRTRLLSLGSDVNNAEIIALPMPDGTFRSFRVWEESVMEDALAAKYSDIKTFSAVEVGNQRVTAKLDFTLFGFHAMIFDGEHTSFINPYDKYNDGYYFAHYRSNEYRPLTSRMQCEVFREGELSPAGAPMQTDGTQLPKLAYRTGNGWNLRTYRLALSANHFYCQAATGLTSPTIAQCLSVMTTTLNRINGVYEREFSVHMNFCANEDTLIWNLASGGPNGADPFSSINTNGAACMTANQTQCDNRIGRSNYDVGHVFTTGGGGISSLGVVCLNSRKAQSCTGSPTPVGDGFDIDYVAHELGHEFGSEHTFNNNMDGSCASNAVRNYAYEPGSGSTVMDYAGICSPDDVQLHSDAYFSQSSLQQIYSYLSTSEDVCAVKTSTGNKLVYLAPYTRSYTIPYKTPFELIGPVAVDSVADTATLYCWAQNNLGDFGSRIVNTFNRGPIFRSYNPVYTPLRVFPKVSMVLSGNLSNAGVDNNQGEKAPDTARFLTFRMTVRNILNGKGCFLVPDDTIHLDAVANSTFSGFKVTSQGTTGISYTGGTSQTITWNVVGTNTAPVNATNVRIYMSVDGGLTWPYYLGSYPNNGSATVNVPNPASNTSQGRFKVKGDNNVFFNVNGRNFTVTRNTSLPNSPTAISAVTPMPSVQVYPNPASGSVTIETGITENADVIVVNTVGSEVLQMVVSQKSDLNVSGWAPGVYYVKVYSGGNLSVVPIVIK